MSSGEAPTLARSPRIEARRKEMLGVEQWAEIRRMREVERLSIREIARRTGRDRNTVRSALRSPVPPRYRRGPRPSKLDPHKSEIHRLLRTDGRLPGKRIRELIEEAGYEGSKTILDDYLREVRPLYLPPRSYQRTSYRPGELLQFDVWRALARDPGRPRPDAPRLRGHLRARLVAGLCLRRWSSPSRRRTSSGESRAASACSARCPGSWSGTARARCTPAAAGRPRSSPLSAVSCRSVG